MESKICKLKTAFMDRFYVISYIIMKFEVHMQQTNDSSNILSDVVHQVLLCFSLSYDLLRMTHQLSWVIESHDKLNMSHF
jgi:hypothetical protein